MCGRLAVTIGMSEGAGPCQCRRGLWCRWVLGLASRRRGRGRAAAGSRWSARSEARTNDLDAGGEWRRLGQVVDAVVVGRVVRTVVPRAELVRVGRLGCRGMSSPM